MRKNTFVVFGTTFVNISLRFISTLLITRILAPEAYALVGMVGSIMFVIQLISDVGIRGYIVKYDGEITDFMLDSLWTIQVIRGVILTFILMLAAYPLQEFLQIKDLFVAICIVSPSFVISGLKSLELYIEDRNNRPAKPIILEFFASTISIIALLCTIFIFRSKWCMVVSQLYAVTIITGFSFVLYKRKKYRFRFNKVEYASFFGWSKYVAASSIVTVFLMQADKFSLAKILDEDQLGLYFLASSLVAIPTTLIKNFSSRLMVPHIASAKKNGCQDVTKQFYLIKNRASVFFLISLAFGFVFSEFIIGTLYDSRYGDVAIFVSLLVIKGFFLVFSKPLEEMLMVMGYVKSKLICNLLRIGFVAICIIPVYIYFNYYGLIVVFSLSEAPALLYLLYFAQKKGYLKSFRELVNFIILAVTLVTFLVLKSILFS